MRLASESRQPGMAAERRCLTCRALLRDDEDGRCIECQPQLSQQARDIGRQRCAELAARIREIHQIETGIRRIERALRKWHPPVE